MGLIYIYTLSASSNKNDIKYIGKTNNIQDRYKRHLQQSYLKANNLKNNWIKSVLNRNDTIHIEIIDIVSENDWSFWESYWIFQLRSWGFNLKNSTYGGDGFYLTSQDVINRRNITNRRNGKKTLTEEHKEKLLLSRLGTKHTAETKQKISKKLKGCKASDSTKKKLSIINKGENNNFFGKTHTHESLLKMCLNHPLRKEINQYTLDDILITTHISSHQIEKELGFSRKHVINCCKNKAKTAYGYKWKFT